jgi:alpha-mannosidase
MLSNELQTPTEYVMDSRHKGTAPWEDSFFEISPTTVAVLALKRAEDAEDAVILRVQERTGKATKLHIQSALLDLHHDELLGPWEIKTIRIQHGKGLQTVSALEV